MVHVPGCLHMNALIHGFAEERWNRKHPEATILRKFDLSIGDLKEMKKNIINVVSEYQFLLTLYAMDKKQARKQGKLKMFPKAFSQWRPQGSMYSESQLKAICAGPQSKATIYAQYFLETKQHSHSYLYISKEHCNKRPSVFYCSSPCSGTSQASQEMNFGVIEQLYKHSFAEKSFMRAAVSLFIEPCFDASCGLWHAENRTGKQILVLLRSVSPPLTYLAFRCVSLIARCYRAVSSQVAHTARAYPGFDSIKQLGVFLLPPGWDATPSQGTSQHYFADTHLYTLVESLRHYESKVSCPRTQHSDPGQGSNLERELWSLVC